MDDKTYGRECKIGRHETGNIAEKSKKKAVKKFKFGSCECLTDDIVSHLSE